MAFLFFFLFFFVYFFFILRVYHFYKLITVVKSQQNAKLNIVSIYLIYCSEILFKLFQLFEQNFMYFPGSHNFRNMGQHKRGRICMGEQGEGRGRTSDPQFISPCQLSWGSLCSCPHGPCSLMVFSSSPTPHSRYAIVSEADHGTTCLKASRNSSLAGVLAAPWDRTQKQETRPGGPLETPPTHQHAVIQTKLNTSEQ